MAPVRTTGLILLLLASGPTRAENPALGAVLGWSATVTAAPVRVLPALVTVCSGLAPGGTFPANTRNTFTAARDANVQFYGYYLLKPWNPAVRVARLVWRDPSGTVFSEYSHDITPRETALADGPAGNILLAQAIGLRTVVTQNGQVRVPDAPGLYTVEAFLDGVPISESVFYLQGSGTRPATPLAPGSDPAGPVRSGAPARPVGRVAAMPR